MHRAWDAMLHPKRTFFRFLRGEIIAHYQDYGNGHRVLFLPQVEEKMPEGKTISRPAHWIRFVFERAR